MATAHAETAAAHPVVRLAAAMAALVGWRRALVAALLGVAAVAALPPVDAVPLVVVAFTGLIWMADGARTIWRAFWLGWWFGLGFFTAGLYWIAAALTVDLARFWWLLPFAVLGVPAFMSLFTGVSVAVYRALGVDGWGRPFALATLWVGHEFLRGHILTGFPWNLVGSAWTVVPPLLQAASVVGLYGLSWLTVAAAALPALLATRDGARWQPGRGGVAAIVAGAVVALAIGGLGALRLAQAPDPAAADAQVPDVRLRLVQPNVEQSLKWRDSERAAIAQVPTAIIWPEAATPFLFERSPEARALAAGSLAEGALLITGTPRMTAGAGGQPEFWNGLVALDRDDTIRGTFDKFHLVPFGEYVPLRGILPIDKIAPGGGAGFSAGPGPRTLHLPGLPPVSPLICYEGIFPGEVIDPDDRPAWLLIITNDAWYGRTSGPFQHFAAAVARAVEQGLPVVRVANTGVSGVIDPYGRVLGRLGLGQGGEAGAILDATLPRPLAEAPPYQRFGGWILAGFMILGLGAGLATRRA